MGVGIPFGIGSEGGASGPPGAGAQRRRRIRRLERYGDGHGDSPSVSIVVVVFEQTADSLRAKLAGSVGRESGLFSDIDKMVERWAVTG